MGAYLYFKFSPLSFYFPVQHFTKWILIYIMQQLDVKHENLFLPLVVLRFERQYNTLTNPLNKTKNLIYLIRQIIKMKRMGREYERNPAKLKTT